MGCTSSSNTTPAAANGSLKNGSALDHANGSAARNGNFELMQSSMNDILPDSPMDFQNANKELEQVGQNLRDAVEESTQEMMEQILTEDTNESKFETEANVDDAETRPTPIPALNPDPSPDLNNTTSDEPAERTEDVIGNEEPQIEASEEAVDPEEMQPVEAEASEETKEEPTQPAASDDSENIDPEMTEATDQEKENTEPEPES